MRSATPSNKLTLIDSGGHAISEDVEVTDPSVDYYSSASEDGNVAAGPVSAPTPILLFVAVSAACAAAAVATGSYAVWLSRHRVAQQTLTDVQDILRVCQDRMTQLETELDHLPAQLTTRTAG